MLNDPVADMLTRIRNAYMAGKKETIVSDSKLNVSILKVLKKHSFISDYEKQKWLTKNKSELTRILVKLEYINGESPMQKIQRVSKPGRRSYLKAGAIKPVLSGYGIGIISTPKGVMDFSEAKNKNLGGEVICRIW